MNQPKPPVEPGFADLNPSLDEVIAEFVSRNPEMAADMAEVMAPDAFEDSAYDVYSGKIKEPREDETGRLDRKTDYVDWVRNGGDGTQAEFGAMKAAQAPAPRFRPTNYDAAVTNGYEGTFSDWLRENASHSYEFREPEHPVIPIWHKVAAVVMVIVIFAVVAAVYINWKNYSGDTMVRTKSVIAVGQL